MSKTTKQKDQDFFKRLYRKVGITDRLFYQDETGNEKDAHCDYVAMTSVTIDLSNGNVVCGFDIHQGNSMLNRHYPADDFLTQTAGKTAFVRSLAKLGYDLGDITEAELISFNKWQYRELRDDPYYTCNYRGWYTYNGARLFITNKAHGASFLCSPRMNPAFNPHPSGSLNAFLKGVNNLIIGHKPAEFAFSTALGAPLFSKFQDKQSSEAVCLGAVSATTGGKTTLLNLMTAVFANPFYVPESDSENEEILPAKFDLNCTSNYLFGSLNKISGIACGLDDFTAGIITDIEKVLYQLALGCEKGRANNEGKSKKRNRFSTYFFINAERSLINLETNGGVFRRYLEIRDMDCCKDAAHAEAIAALSRTHYATLGNDYMARLMKLNDTFLSGLSEYCHNKLERELDSLELKDAKARYALAKSLCYLPASLCLFNQFYAIGVNAPCKTIDVEGFIKWLALKIADNTRENAVSYSFAADIELLKDIVLPRFYARVSDNGGDILREPILGTDPPMYAATLDEIAFDSRDSVEIYADPLTSKVIGRKRDSQLAIQTAFFVKAYNDYIRDSNNNSAVKNRKSCIQFLKELKLNGVLSFDNGKDDTRLTRKVVLPNDGDLSRDFAFEVYSGQNGIVYNQRRCYVFNLAPDSAGTFNAMTTPETDNGKMGGGV